MARKREIKKAVIALLSNADRQLKQASTKRAVRKVWADFSKEISKLQKELGATDDQMGEVAMEVVDELLTRMVLALKTRRTTQKTREENGHGREKGRTARRVKDI